MAKASVRDVGPVAIARIRRQVPSTRKDVSFDRTEGLTFKKHAAGLSSAQRSKRKSFPIRVGWPDNRRLKAVVVHPGNGGDVAAGGVVDRWIGAIRAMARAVEVVI